MNCHQLEHLHQFGQWDQWDQWDEEDLQRRQDFVEAATASRIILPRRQVANRERTDPFSSMRDVEFFEHFGFHKHSVIKLEETFHQELATVSSRKTAQSPMDKLLMFLEYIRCPSYQRVVGNAAHIRRAQATACRTINLVAKGIAARGVGEEI